ncbi:uncharacterized mitochondrial protein-like protein [Tanacetum coccineum]
MVCPSIIGPESITSLKVLQHPIEHKELNPGSFTLPCIIGKFNFYAMADLGASINVMPRSIFEHLHLTNLNKTNMLCEMADMSKKVPLGIVENVLVKIDKFLFPSDFVILDNTPSETTILGRPFLATIHAEIDSNNQIDYEESGNWDNRSPNFDDQDPKKRKINLYENVPRAHFTMAGVDIDTLIMEQYLALSRENQASGVVKPKIRGNANFEIKSQFMCELREDTFFGNKDKDAHDHIDRVLSIVGLFNIHEVSKDAVMLRVFPFTLTRSAKKVGGQTRPRNYQYLGSLQKGLYLKVLPTFYDRKAA